MYVLYSQTTVDYQGWKDLIVSQKSDVSLKTMSVMEFPIVFKALLCLMR